MVFVVDATKPEIISVPLTSPYFSLADCLLTGCTNAGLSSTLTHELLQQAQERLWTLLKYDALQRCPVLVCANKQDLAEAMYELAMNLI